jgi:hypothetical protein
MITMTRIPPPASTPAYARHVVTGEGDQGEQAKAAIAPFLPGIYEELHRRVNDFANDRDQCFEDEDFPSQSDLDGCYYIGSERYEGNSTDKFFRVWLEVRCLAKSAHPSEEATDYLGLEAIVTVPRDGSRYEFDEGFNTSCLII